MIIKGSFWAKMIYCLMFAVFLLLPAQGLGGGSAFAQEKEQELVSAETIRELARIHYTRARNYYRKGDYSKAKAEFEEVLKLVPEHKGASWYLKSVKKELAKYEKSFQGRLEKANEKRKKRNLETALDSVEERSVKGKLRAERARRKQLEKEEGILLEQLEKYRNQADKKKKRKDITVEKLVQLQKEKKELEAKLEGYKRVLQKQQRLIERMQKKSEQKEPERLKEVEAEKRRLSAQLEAELKKYEQSLLAKFDQRITGLNKRIASYEAQINDLQITPQLARTEKTIARERLRKELVQLDRAETGLLELQIKINEQLHAQLDEFKKEKARPFYEQGLAHFKKGKYAKAGETLQKVLSIYPDYAEAKRILKDIETQEKINLHLSEGQYYHKQKEYQRAKQQFNQALALDYKNKEVRNWLHKIEKDIKEEEHAENLARQREQKGLEEEKAHLAERQRKAKERALVQARKELKKKQARLREEEERKARKEKLAKLQAEKEQARLKKEEKLRLRREAEEKRREEARLNKEQERKAREERLAKLEAEKEEKLRLKREEETKRQEEARLRKEEQRKAREERFANLKAQKEERLRLRRETEEKQREERFANLKAQKEERLRLKREAEEKRREEARLKKEQERKGREQRLVKLKAEKEEKLRLKREAEEKRHEETRLRKERQRRAREERLVRERTLKQAQAELAKQAGIEAREEKLRLKREAQAKRQEEARLRKEEQHKAREERLAKLEAEKEEKLRLKREAQAKRREQARLKKERLYRLRLQNEAQKLAFKEAKAKLNREKLRLKKERLAKLKAEKEERLRLKREEEARRREEKQLRQQRIAEEKALKQAQAALAKQAEIKAEERQREQVRLKRKEEGQTREQKLARIKAEKKRKQKELQKKIELHYTQGKKHFQNKDYIAARKEFKDILILDPQNKYAINALEKVNATQEREERLYKRRMKQKEGAERKERERTINRHLAQGKVYFYQENYHQAIEEFGKILFIDPSNSLAEKYILSCKKKFAEAKQREQTRLRKEQERKAREEKLAKLKAEKEEKLRLKREAEERRREQARLKEERERRAHEERLAKLKAEKQESFRLKREAEAKLREQPRLKEEWEALSWPTKLSKTRIVKEEIFELEGRIIAVNDEHRFLVIDIGRDDGVKKGMSFNIYREDKKVGKVEVIETHKNIAACDIKEIDVKRLKVNDIVQNKEVRSYLHKIEKDVGEREEKLRLKREAEERRREQARLENEELKKIKEFYEKGKMYLRRGFYSEAIACFEKVIELEGNPRILYTPQAKEYIERARIKQEQKKKEDAEKIAEEEVKRKRAEETQRIKAKERAQAQTRQKEEESVRKHYKLGKKYYRRGNYPMAIAEFNKIKEINPQHSYVTYAEKYIQKCRQKIIGREEAELKAEMKKETRALKKEEEESLSKDLLEQAHWYYRRANFEQTAKICRALLNLDPLNKKARNLLYAAELKQVRRDKKQADKEIWIDEKEMMTEVAEVQVLPLEKTVPVKEKIIPIVKVPAIREKLKSSITVDFRDVDLSYVLNFLADSCGVNIIPASGVSLEGKKVTIRMKDIPAEKALKYILKNQGLSYRIEQDAVWVASPAEMDKE